MQIFWQRKITRTRTRGSEVSPYKFFDEESEIAHYEVKKQPKQNTGYSAVFELHGNRIVGVTGNVPAGAIVGVREQGVSARNIFLGAIGIDLVLNFIVFLVNGQDARSMNGAVCDTQLG